jgi:ATP-dependent DNA helicase RecG
MREGNLTPPTFESDRQKDLFVATFLFHHFLGPDDWEWLRSLGVDALTDEDARALVYVRETLSIDNAAYRDLNQVDVLNASQHLRRFRDQGLLEQRGKGSATFYTPTAKFLATLPLKPSSDAILDIDPLSVKPDPLSVKPDPLSVKPDPLSVKPEGKSEALPELPPDLLALLHNVKARMETDALQNITCRLCAWHPLSAGQLAILLRRSRNYVQNRLLTPLLQERRILPTIADHPKHPRQAYRTAQPEEEQS